MDGASKTWYLLHDTLSRVVKLSKSQYVIYSQYPRDSDNQICGDYPVFWINIKVPLADLSTSALHHFIWAFRALQPDETADCIIVAPDTTITILPTEYAD